MLRGDVYNWVGFAAFASEAIFGLGFVYRILYSIGFDYMLFFIIGGVGLCLHKSSLFNRF